MCTDLKSAGKREQAGRETAEETSSALVQLAWGRVLSSFDLEITAQWFLLPRVSGHVERFSDVQRLKLPELTVATECLKCSSPKLRRALCAKYPVGLPALVNKGECKFLINTSIHTY